jgi:hypothetical protein
VNRFGNAWSISPTGPRAPGEETPLAPSRELRCAGRPGRAVGPRADGALIDGGEVQCWGFGGAGNNGRNESATIGDAPGEMVPPRFALIYPNP